MCHTSVASVASRLGPKAFHSVPMRFNDHSGRDIYSAEAHRSSAGWCAGCSSCRRSDVNTGVSSSCTSRSTCRQPRSAAEVASEGQSRAAPAVSGVCHIFDDDDHDEGERVCTGIADTPLKSALQEHSKSVARVQETQFDRRVCKRLVNLEKQRDRACTSTSTFMPSSAKLAARSNA